MRSLTPDAYFGLGLRDQSPIAAATGRNTALVVSYARDPSPPDSVITRATQGMQAVLNVIGSTSIDDPDLRLFFFNVVLDLFGGNDALPFQLAPISVGSGGTRVLTGASGDPQSSAYMTAVEAPGLAFLACQRYTTDTSRWIRSWGHTPRTARALGYGGKFSSFELDERRDAHQLPNPLLHVLWIVQVDATKAAKWDGDVPMYTQLLEIYQGSGEGQSGNLVLGGGGVSAFEVYYTVRSGIPLLGMLGTGRVADYLPLLLSHKLDQVPEGAIRDAFRLILDEGLDTATTDWGLPLITTTGSAREGHEWLEQMGMGRRLY